jgi:hypothetical protein
MAVDRVKEAFCQGNKVAMNKAKEASAKVWRWRWTRPRRTLPRYKVVMNKAKEASAKVWRWRYTGLRRCLPR